MYCVRKTKALPHAGPGTNFYYANNTRARANAAPSTPAGWLCVAWLEDSDVGNGGDVGDVGDMLVGGDTTEAGLRVLAGDAVTPPPTAGVDVGRATSVLSGEGICVGVEVCVGTEGPEWEIQLDIFRTDAQGTVDITHQRPQED